MIEGMVPVLVVSITGILLSILYYMRLSRLVPVRGFDFSTGQVFDRKLKPNREGAVVWRRQDKSKTLIPLDARYGFPNGRGLCYHADITPGQGRLMKAVPSDDWPRLSGDRCIEILAAGLMRQTAEAANEAKGSVWVTIAIIAGVVLIATLGAIVYLIRELNASGAI